FFYFAVNITLSRFSTDKLSDTFFSSLQGKSDSINRFSLVLPYINTEDLSFFLSFFRSVLSYTKREVAFGSEAYYLSLSFHFSISSIVLHGDTFPPQIYPTVPVLSLMLYDRLTVS
ncbi:MAG TPA: hypothetical protein VFG36_03825, partial [Methanoregula sp.]|nr:hypothetical protein [Methanoregula sp.]